MRVHHGGRFHSNRGLNRHYRGGEVCFVDGVDRDKVSMTQIHYWANDLGYQSPPIQFWFRIPGSEEGSGYLPLGDDIEAIEMCDHVSPRTKLLDMYIVCTSERKVFCEEELNVYNEDLDHTSLLGWWIDDVEEGEPNHEEDDVDENLNDVFGFGNDDLVDDDGRNDEALIRDGHVDKRAAAKGKQKVQEGAIPPPNKKRANHLKR